jgi:hypothetical protein
MSLVFQNSHLVHYFILSNRILIREFIENLENFVVKRKLVLFSFYESFFFYKLDLWEKNGVDLTFRIH